MTDIINKLQAFMDANPQSIAVRHITDELTYQQLMDESSKLAHRLQGSKKPVILFGHMSPYMVVGMIDAIKAGCGYAPVDTSIPKDRVKMIINKIQPGFVFNMTDESFESLEDEVFTIEDIKIPQDPVIFGSQIRGNDTVCTIFTSGSTGESKGIQIEYTDLVQFTEWILELNKSGNEQQWLNQAPFSFDLSIMAIYPCSASGGTLNLVGENTINKPKLLNEIPTATPINVRMSTPSFMKMCLLLLTLNEEQHGSLNEFFLCGEVLPHRAAKALVNRFLSATIYSAYGPTEATIAVASIQVTQEILDQYPTLPVGVGGPGARLSTTDESELIIEGRNVSLGHLKNDQKTAEVFSFDDSIRTYHTGGKAKFKNGRWFTQGRIDFQIKLNGYRVELEEIKTQLRQSESVKEAIIVPVYKSDKVIHSIGAIVPATEVTDNAEMTENIRNDLKSRLPRCMIPRRFKWMEQLPLTSNGKIDRKKVTEVISG